MLIYKGLVATYTPQAMLLVPAPTSVPRALFAAEYPPTNSVAEARNLFVFAPTLRSSAAGTSRSRLSSCPCAARGAVAQGTPRTASGQM
jgi:hypothetical protein